MLTRDYFNSLAMNFYDWCKYPAVKYKILFHFLEAPSDNKKLAELRQEFLYSDIVNQLYEMQSPYGDWGPLRTKDYSCKSVFPTTMVAIERCLYIGLTLEDKDILLLALDYLEEILKGTSRIRLYNRNERAVPWQMCDIASLIERIKPNNLLCDKLWNEWNYIASRAFEDGEYSHERDKKAQHEVLLTREDRLIPLPLNLLLTRPMEMHIPLEKALLNYYGRHAYYNGYFWDKSLDSLPDIFAANKTRRYFHAIKYINQFRYTDKYLEETIEWLLKNKNSDALWNYGTQTKDPWGYFGYFSTNNNYKYNNLVDCTMEVLSIFKTFLDHNPKE